MYYIVQTVFYWQETTLVFEIVLDNQASQVSFYHHFKMKIKKEFTNW